MPSSSSGDGRFLGQKPGSNKIKADLSSGRNVDASWKTVGYKKNKNNSANNKVTSANDDPVSPSLQHIIDNHPTLDLSNTDNFTYDTSMITDSTESPPNNYHTDNETIDINNSTEPGSVITNTITSNLTFPGTTHTNHTADDLCHFNSDFNGTPIIIIELTDSNLSSGSWHPLKWAKFLSKNFLGINNIKPNGHKKVKITFDSIDHANICLKSPLLSDNNLSAYIPSTLIYSHGIIKLDTSFPEEDFWEGQVSDVPIKAFKRIIVNRDGKLTPTRIVELKFLATKIPVNISIFNIIFEVSPSVRAPLQCNNCLRFGHTTKFCRSDPRCSHCGESKHTIVSCPIAQATDPNCLFCHLPHLATDRNCQEWDTQRDIKKIMATENISFREAASLKNQNQVTSAFTYSNIVNKKPMISPPKNSSPQFYPALQPPALTPNHFHQNNFKKSRPRSPNPVRKHFNLPPQMNFSNPNGAFLEYATNCHSNNDNTTKISDFSWVSTLTTNLTQSLINTPLSSQTANSLHNLIESSLLSLLAIPNVPTITLP